MADFPMWQKVAVTAACNVVGVFLVKWCEERAEKTKLWKVEATCKWKEAGALIEECESKDLSFNYIDVNKYIIFNFYCATKEESAQVKGIQIARVKPVHIFNVKNDDLAQVLESFIRNLFRKTRDFIPNDRFKPFTPSKEEWEEMERYYKLVCAE